MVEQVQVEPMKKMFLPRRATVMSLRMLYEMDYSPRHKMEQ